MPYIKPNERAWFSDVVPVTRALHNSGNPGHFNYVITRILNDGLGLTRDPSYAKINTALGILEAVKLELYRRVAVTYEEQKRHENGDVY